MGNIAASSQDFYIDVLHSNHKKSVKWGYHIIQATLYKNISGLAG